MVLGTPFRTPNQAFGSTPGRMLTPQIGGERVNAGSLTPSQTPLRDQLSINPDDAIESFGNFDLVKQQQLELRAQLKTGLGSLPAPKNDFEIVLPENDGLFEETNTDIDSNVVEDAAEIEERNARLRKAEGIFLVLHFACDRVDPIYLQRKRNGIASLKLFRGIFLVLLMLILQY